jgi:2-polyprenyl-6-methoxyphenol hydroxylase-like FAD-dependent oxidoreductase
MDQGGNGVLIRFSDGTEAEGDILVGADGAYSAVRQGLYAKLKKTKKLPMSDELPLPFSTVCLVAQTRPLTPEEFPEISLDKCQFRNTIGTNKMYTVCPIQEGMVSFFTRSIKAPTLTLFLYPHVLVDDFDNRTQHSLSWGDSLLR